MQKHLLHNIAFISEHASPLASLGSVDTGGQNVYVAQLAKHIAAKGYQVDIYTRKDNLKLSQIVNWMPGIRVIHIDAGPAENIPKEQLLSLMPLFFKHMMEFITINKVEYSLVHAHFFMSAMVASEIKKALGLPYVISFHALGYIRRLHQEGNDQFAPERLKIEKELMKDADLLIASCPQDQEDMIMHYRADKRKIKTVPCGFSSEEFRPVNKRSARKVIGHTDDVPLLLQLGRMVPRKGIDNVILAVAALKAKGKKVKLLIVGGDLNKYNDPELSRLRAIVQKNGLDEQVMFTGSKTREELKYYYSAADIFITTPWYEPFGITPLEAMACGTPVIGSDVGGIKYTVQHGKNGALVPPKNPESLAEKIDEMLGDTQQLQQMGKQALKIVNKHFTWANVANETGKIYNQVIQKTAAIISDDKTQAA